MPSITYNGLQTLPSDFSSRSCPSEMQIESTESLVDFLKAQRRFVDINPLLANAYASAVAVLTQWTPFACGADRT